MLLANISREVVESGISCTSVIHITLSTLNQCAMHKLFFLFLTARNRKKKLLNDNNNSNRRIPLLFTLSSIYSTIASGAKPFSRSNPSWLMTFIKNDYKPLTKLVKTLMLKSLSDVLNVSIVDSKRQKMKLSSPTPST